MLVTNLNQFLTHKKILILGFGKEGQSTYNYLQTHVSSAKIEIADKNPALKINSPNLKLHLGPDYLNALNNDYDLIIKSPGISIKNINTTPFIHKLTSQTDLFLKFYKNQVIGITGTKGKSTVASLLYHILKTAQKDVQLIGNIGYPAFEILDKIKDDTLLVYELSSHQLEFIKSSPHIAVLLNIYEEHLDFYDNFTAYKYAKCNIFKFQDYIDYFIYNKKDQNITEILAQHSLKQESYPIYDQDHKLSTHLLGKHNLFNINAAITVCQILKIPAQAVKEGLSSYQPLPHRLEYVGKYNEIDYYNDSIATIPEATIAAINTLEKKLETIILGGFDRKICYKELCQTLLKSKIKNIILLPDTGNTLQSILNQTKHHKNIKLVNTLEEAVTLAQDLTSPNKTCLFSPAAASYNQFKNFEERGNKFKKLINS
ncbi:UDP-N-acetylmuramoyl-L-alanine--D-glutamate ligase [bacterium]|jgi:UDP-N-acetylmuramoyl-L-alanine---L-glutamate ligase|nr:UDP-N-acetylmuramoyl-L-alanine--D-glutamate ligase [bacterium]MBT3581907.1 UDP-N-acetylmuramoyl-L-alanine--D-glutamate ligase [bacterium]MBT4551427.1 UDP-N-acetylmuramoyl-L-alanine--D-glutamate ligase [bacterium]MBT5988722.1 UDP-N-acetylmuramoyl-L-alanine--D-glutamate ligase [bacterium]MBT7088264.1 UDP-N-acetylmuramoyl-L-alanine--D-glutamate ligase [bacterium]